jgi:hypothetical protein
MSEPRIRVRKRRKLSQALDDAVDEDAASIVEMEKSIGELIASAKRMNVKPLTLLFMTGQLKEMAQMILYNQCLKGYDKDIGEPTAKELRIIQKEFEKMCLIVQEKSLETLIAKQGTLSRVNNCKRSPGNAPSGPMRNNEEQPYVGSKERPYYVQ